MYDEEFDTPRWMREGLLYQIMPDRFAAHGKNAPEAGWLHEKWDEPPAIHVDPSTHDNRADDFFGGNFRGVMDRLDYLKELGVTAIYFNPIFRARSNHKYDTGDYETIDPSFGTREDFEALIAIKSITDSGSNAEVRKKNGHLCVYEVERHKAVG